MKKSALVLTLLAVLCLCSSVFAGDWNLAELKTQAAKAIPNGQEIGAAADKDSAFVGMQANGLNYQFTLASDQESQMPDAQVLEYKGHKAFFFEPGMPGSGGLMILLDSKKSLTILCMAGFDSDKEITSENMTAIADKMNLGAL
ncbi:hypothetical protein SYK_26040 [Pseudodesulfovibrio nedwellii]|uniref:Uncharacterized protein n=1 Tax=Pseudodesulfovibrio nedwellii TaxID=2973072 RepID=A0ABM8B3P1_9BACT|nr:hypothetical protein [Pseudodesulfovibrio nedwellii]BDQ38244.1 hypothetical protein SYK_26040 [Pseudodesulfovibrio nedwellii]